MPASFMEAIGGQFFAGTVLGDRTDGIYIYHRKAAGALDYVAGHGGAIIDRLGVGHAADGGESSRCRSPRAGFYGFGMFKAGLAQMHVHVDEAGGDDQARGIEVPLRWHRYSRRSHE